MEISHPDIGICGLSCRLCPKYHTEGVSRCDGCKTASRMGAGCPFITCAIRRKGIEFCWDCDEGAACDKWAGHRAFSRQYDTFVCYQKLEDNIAIAERDGIGALDELHQAKLRLLAQMLREFNDGRSKSRFCVAATVLGIDELEGVLATARDASSGLDIKAKAKVLHTMLDELERRQQQILRLRRWPKAR